MDIFEKSAFKIHYWIQGTILTSIAALETTFAILANKVGTGKMYTIIRLIIGRTCNHVS
jgi:hypothetical protein